jgi:hypothetical protein
LLHFVNEWDIRRMIYIYIVGSEEVSI